MKAFIQYLQERKGLNLLIAFIYFLLVVLPHEQVGLLTVKIFGGFSRDTYNAIILGVSLLGLSLYLVPILKNVLKDKRWWTLFYLISSILFSVISFKTLVVINIEVVHFLQYAMMAILLFPLISNYHLTLFYTTLLGALDEAYQYFYLAPQRTDYYDFNDVIINLLGATFGLLFLRAFHIPNQKFFWRSPIFLGCCGLIVLLIGLYASGILPVYPVDAAIQPLSLLVKKVPDGFWSVVHPNVTYHVIQPLEGLLLTFFLWLFYKKI